MKKSLITYIATLPILLAGCSSNDKGLYFWGDYSSSSFEYTQEELTDKEYLDILTETQSESAKKLPPGFLADLGTLYLQMGDSQQALNFYRMEAEAWPEGFEFMNALIQGVTRAENRHKTTGSENNINHKEGAK